MKPAVPLGAATQAGERCHETPQLPDAFILRLNSEVFYHYQVFCDPEFGYENLYGFVTHGFKR